METHHVPLFHDPETWVAIAFVIFVVAFGAKLWQALAAQLDRRSTTIRAELDEASRLKAEAAAMLAEARTRRDQAVREADALLRNAHDEAGRLAEEARRTAAATAARREKMAMDRIAAAEHSAVAALRAQAVDAATGAAALLLSQQVSAQVDLRLVDGAIAALPSRMSNRRTV